MIEVAKRLSEVKEYYFSKKLAQIKEMNDAGLDVINLGIGSPDMAPHSDVINKAIESISMEESHAYQSYKGIDELRIEMSKWYKKYFNVDLNYKEEVLPLMGSKEGIMHISMAFLNKGDKVLIPDPGYPSYSSATKMMEAEIINYPLLEANNWEPDFDYLQSLDLTDVKIMWVNYPNMPTGAKASIKLFEKLVSFARKNNILIVNDNPYSFVLNSEHISILNIEGAKDCALELNSLSKSSNMAGWRVGMLFGNKYFIENVLRVKSNMDSGMFLPIQKGAIEALKMSEGWYKNINKVYAERKKLVHKLFDVLKCEYRTNDSGMFVWAKVPKEKSAIDISERILNEAKVFVTPGAIFGENGKNYLRISLSTKDERIKEAINRIEKVI